MQKLFSKIPAQYHAYIKKAIAFANGYCNGEKMLNGKEYLEHSINVALILCDWDLDVNTIIVGIIHHAVRFADDKELVYSNVKKEFGEDVCFLLEQLHKIFYSTKYSTEISAITKYILKSTTDLRIIFVRLADKLDNTRTLNALPNDKQLVFADKLLKIYSPLAEYLNLIEVKNEFDDAAFKVKYPQEHRNITEYLERNNLRNNEILKQIEEYLNFISSEIVKDNTPIVFGRIKSPYSIFRKARKYSTEGKKASVEQFKDIIAFTIIAKTIPDCYQIAGAIRGLADWTDDSFEDYIREPKPNGFSELQIVVSFPDISDLKIEVQILTMEMYHYNTYGPASHFAYKMQGARYAKATNEFSWIEDVKKSIESSLKQNEKLSCPMPTTLFSEQTFVWTPKNELIDLPNGATALDFAFAIHTDIGLKAESAIVNGIRQPLNYVLQNGDVVEISQAKNRSKNNNVKSEWRQWVVTSKAKDKIEKVLKKW